MTVGAAARIRSLPVGQTWEIYGMEWLELSVTHFTLHSVSYTKIASICVVP
jgi:hypothetical protein